MDTILELNTIWTLNPQQDWNAIRSVYAAIEENLLDMIQGDFDLPFASGEVLTFNSVATDVAIRVMYSRDCVDERVNWLKEGF